MKGKPEPEGEPTQRGTIKLEPTWRGVLPLLLAALRDGTETGQRLAREELARMAEAADLANGIPSCPARRPSLPMTGAELRSWRLWAGVTQQQLADAIGLSRVTVSQMETGRAKITLTTTLAVENVLTKHAQGSR